MTAFLAIVFLTAPVAFAQSSNANAFTGETARPAGKTTRLDLAASLIDGSEAIPTGVKWRVFSPDGDADGKLPLIDEKDGGLVSFELPEGTYLVHAAYGRAGVTKKVTLNGEPRTEHVVFNAGGVKLNAVLSGGVRIPANKLRFSIYDLEEDADGDRRLIIGDVTPNSIVRLNAGTYHVVSTYGVVNAVIRADIRVEPGKLTSATIEHRAAQLTFKLVREQGGEAIADTAWAILTESGDTVRETVGAFASMVLAEGDYTAIAKNKDRIFQRDFTVVAGRNQDVEVMAVE